MKSNPLGIIVSEQINVDQNYATVVLEAFSTLESTQNIFIKQNNIIDNQALTSKQIQNLLNNIYSSPNLYSASELINNLYNYALNYNKDLNNCNSPYTFLYYLLTILEEENKKVFGYEFNIHQTFPSLDNAISFLGQIYQSLNNSLILKNYYFSMIKCSNCSVCNSNNIQPLFRKSIDLNIDEFIQQNQGNPFTLNDCLKYYFSPKTAICKICNQLNESNSRVIVNTGPVLIINLMRNGYTGNQDQNFIIDLNLNILNYKKDISDGNNNYSLKACVCFSKLGFFVDCFVKRDNMMGAWYRYMNKQQIEINQNQLFSFQPVLLFYESCINQNNFNNMNNNIMQNNNFNLQNNIQDFKNNNQNINMNQDMNINININNQNNQINENNENKLNINNNFNQNLNVGIAGQMNNFGLNNNNQSNFQMNNNFSNLENQNKNNFNNNEFQNQNQINQQMNQNNNFINMNNNINQNLFNNSNQNVNQMNQNIEFNINQNNHNENQNINISPPNNDLNPNLVQNLNQNLNSNNNMNINIENNMNQINLNNLEENKNLNSNLNDNININANAEVNKNIVSDLENRKSAEIFGNNNDNLINNANKNIQEKNQIENNFIGVIKNEIEKNIHPNQNIDINKNENLNQSIPQNNQNFNNININPEIQEPPKNIPQNQSNDNLNPQSNNNSNSPQISSNINNNEQGNINNSNPNNFLHQLNNAINQNLNNSNNQPQIVKPKNIPNKINQAKKEEAKPVKKVPQKPVEKKEEKNKNEPKAERKLSFQEKIKLMQGGVKLNQPQPAAPKKRFNKEELSHKFQKNEPKNVQKPMQVGSGFNEKMKNMQAMFAQKGGFGAPRPSAQIMGMPHELANLMINNNDNNQGQSHEDLEKKLENIVVQKNKKKKKKISFENDDE